MAGAAASERYWRMPGGERTKRARFYVFLTALLLMTAAFLGMIAPYLLSLFFGGLLALMTRPAYDRLRARLPGAKTAAAATVLLTLVLVLGPLAGFSFIAGKQAAEVGRHLSDLPEFSPGRLTRMLGRTPVARALGDPKELKARLREGIQTAGAAVTAAVLSAAKGVPMLLLQLLMTLIAFYFLLIDGPAFVEFSLSRAALDADVRNKLRRTFSEMTRSTVLSGFAAGAAQGAVMLLAYLVLGIPGAFVAGAGTFILAWFPMIGSLPAAAAGVGWLYAQDDMVRMGVMIALGAAAAVADNFVRPLVLKGRGDLHPLVGLVAIVAAVDMFGVLGVFVGPLLAAVLITLLEIWPEVAGRFGVEVEGGG